MEYHELNNITREDAERILDGDDSHKACIALIELTHCESDWKWMQEKCLNILDGPDEVLASAAVTCLGHIARLHRQLDKDKVIKRLREYTDPEMVGRAGDAIDDILIFIKDKRR